MGSTAVRMRYAVLWLVVGSALTGSMVVFFAEPGRLAEGVTGVMEGEPVTMGMAHVYTALIGLPLALAAATPFLSERAGAIANLVVGIPVGAFGLYAAVSEATGGAWHPHLTLGALAAGIAWLVVGLSIAGLRRGPRRDAASAALTVELRTRGT